METYCALLSRREGATAAPQVFLTPVNDAWRLPSFVPKSDIHNTNAQAANRLVRDQLGVSVVTRQALRLLDPILGGPLNVYVMEVYDDADRQAPKTSGTWFELGRFQKASLGLPKERAVLAAWFAEAGGQNLPSLRLPWWQEGWFAATADWLLAQVSRLGGAVLAPVEQVRSAYTSAILRALTDEGFVYLKVVPAVFAHEPPLTRLLAQGDSAHFPAVLMAAEERMLLRDMRDHRPPGRDTSLGRWEEILRFYGQMQVSSAGAVEQWLSLGCLDLRMDSLATQLDQLLAQVPDRLRGLPQQLSAEELTGLRALATPLREMCIELSGCGVPDALDHGDLHAGNIALSDGGFRLYDWSHACVTHPFHGFGSLLLDDEWFPGQPDSLPRLRDAYMDAWTGYAAPAHLRKAFSLWSRLRQLFTAAHQSHVVSAYQGLLQGRDYIAETATGDALQHMQWWLADHWRKLLHSFEAEKRPRP